MSVDGWACPKCGADDRFYQDVEVTMDTSRDATLVRGEDGKLKFDFSCPDMSYAGQRDVTGNGPVTCGECRTEFRNGVEDLRYVWDDYRPGDAVILPDGLRGFVDWFRDGLIAIVGWHERFSPWEVYSPVPIARSEPLNVDGP